MSKAVVHMGKFTTGAVTGMQIHNQREKAKEAENKRRSNTNPDINWDKTHENYELHNEHDIKFMTAVNKRIKQLDLPKAVRKDAIVMCEFIITSDKEFFDGISKENQQKYFKDAYNFMCDRYGKENVITARVHLDETTPHMHFSIVPVTKDGRLSAKSLFTKQELQQLHTDFHKSVGSKFGLERGELGSKAKHIETAELKLLTANNELQETSKQIAHRKSLIDRAVKNLEEMKQLQEVMNGNLSKMKAEYDSVKTLVDRYNAILEQKADKSTLNQLKADIRKEKALEYINKSGQMESFERFCKGDRNNTKIRSPHERDDRG